MSAAKSSRSSSTPSVAPPMEFVLRGDYVELCNLLKLCDIAQSGGQGKIMVSDGAVKVDGHVELRKTAKIRAGQRVECFGQQILVKEA